MRAVAMRSRVLRRFDWLAPAAGERALLDACITAALSRREALLDDEEDPRFLHPARSVLILLDDAEVSDAAVLGAAALVESGERGLALPDAVLAPLPPSATVLAAAVPVRADARAGLLEALVTASRDVRLIACAERLDVVRHAHMLPAFEPARWLDEVGEVYLPVARRTCDRLALRFERWAVAWRRRERA